MSEIKGKQLLWIVAAVLAFIAYFFLAARPLRREPGLVPVWALSLSGDVPAAPASGGGRGASIPFKLDGRMGYFSSEGRILLSTESGRGSAVAEYAYAKRDPSTGRVRFSAPDGSRILETSAPGYPVLGAGRFLILAGEGQSVAEYGRDGRLLWERDFPSLITAIDVKGGSLAAGCLDGSILVIGPGGAETYRFVPGGSRIQAIYGLALSDDESALAAVAGADKQRFLYIEKKGGAFKVAYHAYLASDYRRAVPIRFASGGTAVYFEQEEGLAAFDVSRKRLSTVSVLGRVAAFGLGSPGAPFAFLSDSGRGLQLSVNLPASLPRLRSPFPGSGAFLAEESAMLFAGSGRALVRLDAREE